MSVTIMYTTVVLPCPRQFSLLAMVNPDYLIATYLPNMSTISFGCPMLPTSARTLLDLGINIELKGLSLYLQQLATLLDNLFMYVVT